jgi:uncharacterized repeat protein (TIGR04138 family)
MADDLLARIRAREDRFDEQAYLFVLGGIEFLQTRFPVRRHVSGQELALGVRDFAIEHFGLLAPTVLGHWGVRSSSDIGAIVFALVEVGLLVTQPGDRVEDFDGLWDFTTGFEHWNYVWRGLPGRGLDGNPPRELT